MSIGNELSGRACWPLLAALLAGALLAVWARQRTSGPAAPAPPLDGWDIPRLAAHLNGEGLGLRMVATQKDGAVHQTAFLTTTGKGWEDLNRLPKDLNQINRWQGTLYCERVPGGDGWPGLAHPSDDCCLVVGPFLLYGDRELLGRVRAALTALAQPGS
jgi:hypothetical protein